MMCDGGGGAYRGVVHGTKPGVTAGPQVHAGGLLLRAGRLLQCGTVTPAVQVEHRLLLPFLLQQLTEVMELIYAGG